MKVFIGKVISTKMENTATVAVGRVIVHPVYKKRIRRMKKYHVHDEIGAALGDKVKFVASKPYSKLKKWKIIEIVGKENKNVKGKGGARKRFRGFSSPAKVVEDKQRTNSTRASKKKKQVNKKR